jgi:hypothetical protein
MASQREFDHLYRMRRLQFWQDFNKRAATVLCVLIFGATVYLTFRVLAGRQTFADIVFRFAADIKADKPVAIALSWALTSITGAWGLGERYLRRRYIEKHHPMIKRYQETLDAKRGSSGLTPIGTTQVEDI